eukprot:1149069-Prymnesium_polylepis.1
MHRSTALSPDAVCCHHCTDVLLLARAAGGCSSLAGIPDSTDQRRSGRWLGSEGSQRAADRECHHGHGGKLCTRFFDSPPSI